MADPPAFRSDLAKTGRAKITRVHGDDGRTFRGAIAFERTDAEAVLECQRQTLRQFFRADHHVLQAAEILGRTAPRVRLQKCGRGHQERHAIVAHEFADGGEIERAGMVDHAHAQRRGQPQRHREAERMKERQHAQQAIVGVEHEHLPHLLDIGGDVVVREHHALGLARAAAGKNNRGEIVEGFVLSAAQSSFEHSAGQKPQQQRHQPLAEAVARGDFFEQDRFPRNLQRNFDRAAAWW